MLFHQLEQGSDAWLEFRANHWNASETPILTHCAPTWWRPKNIDELRQSRAGLLDHNKWTKAVFKRAHDMEARVREWLLETRGLDFIPHVATASNHPKLSASFDGVILPRSGARRGLWLEVKAPTHNATWHNDIWGFDDVPLHIKMQIIHQAIVMGVGSVQPCPMCWLVIAPQGTDPADWTVFEDLKLNEWVKVYKDRIIKAWEDFDAGRDLGRKDDEWAKAVADYRHWSNQVVLKKAELKTAQDSLRWTLEDLVQLADGKETEGAGASLLRTHRKGVVDWDKLRRERQISDAEIETYRKPGSKGWRVKLDT